MKIQKLYYKLGDPLAYSGSPHLNKRDSARVFDWLTEQDAFTLHRQVRKKFPRRSYHVSNVDDLWEIDLMDLRTLRSDNDDNTSVMVVIDVFSKFAFAEPQEKKNASCVCEGFRNVLNRAGGRSPIILQSDRGEEFTNKTFLDFVKKQHILFRIAPSPDVITACAERFIRSLKTRMWRILPTKILDVTWTCFRT